jgi:4-hydroxybenzoate polyprenyltransferase
MNKVVGILKLVRWVNLLIIALSMYLFQFCIIQTFMDAARLDTTMNWFYFSLLVFSTVLIAAAGNVVNAYFDYEQDIEYKPEKTMIGRYISLETAFVLQMVLNVVGVLIAFFLSYHFGKQRLGYVFLCAAALLWLYSQVLKKYFLIGNLVVAGLSSLVFVLPVLFEAHLTSLFTSDDLDLARSIILNQLRWYCLFAFVVSLMREIAKDAEDREADAAFDMKTIPVVLSAKATNIVLALTASGSLVVMFFVESYFWGRDLKKHFWYTIFFLCLPMLITVVLALRCKVQRDYKNLSLLLKLIMFLGIASLQMFYLFITIWR